VHVVNNYFNSSSADYNIAAGVSADIRVENNVFDASTTYVDLSKADGDTKVTSLGNSPNVTTSKGTAFTPPYTLSKANASAVKALVSNASCGAGATLKTSGCTCVLLTGIDDASTVGQTASVYPNPSALNFNLHTATTAQVKVFNANGVLVDNFEANGDYGFGTQYKAGIYMLQITQQGKTSILKITKE
jgi:hypothetical protein